MAPPYQAGPTIMSTLPANFFPKVAPKTLTGGTEPSFSNGLSKLAILTQLGSAGLSSTVYELIRSFMWHWAAWR